MDMYKNIDKSCFPADTRLVEFCKYINSILRWLYQRKVSFV